MTSNIRHDDPIALARTSLIAVSILLACQLIFNIVAARLNWPWPLANFLCCQGDYYADYFKFILSYPGSSTVALPDWWIVREQIAPYLIANPYQGAEGLGRPAITHLHVTPLSTLYSLANLWMMRWTNPLLLFGAQLAGLVCYWWAIVRHASVDRREALYWLGLGLISYPALMIVARGNLFAAFAGVAIIHAMLLALRGRGAITGAVLLAIAINIRPNAMIFALAFLLLHWSARYRVMTIGAITTLALFSGSLLWSGWIYPDYDFAHFLAGLRNYYQFYVVDGGGVAYGSSLSGALAFLFAYRPGIDRLALVIAMAPFIVVLFEHARNRIDPPILLFATCATYVLASTVLADYHLLPFLLVPIAVAWGAEGTADPRRDYCRKIMLVASLLVLAPKNYLFQGPASWQVVLNPAILLIAMILLCASLVLRRPGQSAQSIKRAGSRATPGP